MSGLTIFLSIVIGWCVVDEVITKHKEDKNV